MGNAVFDYIHIDDVDYFQFIRIPKFQFFKANASTLQTGICSYLYSFGISI